jgi:cysteine desulfurase / selenocysteine lyase
MLVDRSQFPLLAAQPTLRYLDSAATSQKPQVVLDAMRDYYTHDNANPHRGAYALSARATERYHEARAAVARFIGAGADPATVLFTRGTTEAMNLIANTWGSANIGPGDRIVVTRMEHHANFVPWQQLAKRTGAEFRIVELTTDGELDIGAFIAALDGPTKLVAFTHVSNVLGTINPVSELAAMARASGAVTVCDGAQAVPHVAVDVHALGVDFYAFSAHKLGGPTGVGALWGRRALLEAMPPWQLGGDMIEWVHDQDSTWNVIPHKFEAGTPNVGGAVGFGAAVTWLQSLGLERVRAHEQTLVGLAMERLRAIDGVTVFGPPAERRSGAVSFAVDGLHPHDLAQLLDAEEICVRAGHHCAQPLMRALGEAATTRASFWVYSDASDVDALVAAVLRSKERFAV